MGKLHVWIGVLLSGIAAAVAAGTLPDVIKAWLGQDRWLLTSLCVGSAGLFMVVNLLQQRRKGVGIVVEFEREDRPYPWNEQWAFAAIDHARRNYDSCFMVRRRIPEVPDQEEGWRSRKEALELANELIAVRLTEIPVGEPTTPVALYLGTVLPDAFELGGMLKFNVHRGMTVMQRSESGKNDFFPAIQISGRLKEELSGKDAVKAEALVRVVNEPEFTAAVDGDAVAIVVHLSNNPRMVEQSLQAARKGCADIRGRVARCRAALVLDGGPANIPENRADFELVVRRVYSAWREWAANHPQYAELQPRLFLAAPASIGFALGWLFGHTVTIVPHH